MSNALSSSGSTGALASSKSIEQEKGLGIHCGSVRVHFNDSTTLVLRSDKANFHYQLKHLENHMPHGPASIFVNF
ncbi:hypothetical protein M413DRAFT_31199 [Hebeloma cylindrosporum]|uniref:POLO box domain-containing protein n=1 Tax=Hebeloma cylindrosporum TaxID=76867 RepID=A0A0C3BJX9_HEBCY|nr:hypothetical protein M413DRAFT_31199 [Hebeloma cylindrosporum h7]